MMEDYTTAYIVDFYTESGERTHHFGKAQEWHEQDKKNVHATLLIDGKTKKTGKITAFYRASDGTDSYKVMFINVGLKRYSLHYQPIMKERFVKDPIFIIEGVPAEKAYSMKAIQREVEKKKKVQLKFTDAGVDITTAFIKDVNPENRCLTSVNGVKYKIM